MFLRDWSLNSFPTISKFCTLATMPEVLPSADRTIAFYVVVKHHYSSNSRNVNMHQAKRGFLLTGNRSCVNLISNKIKREFFQDMAVSVLMYGCTTWTLTECMEKKLERYKHATYCFEQIQDAAPNKTATIRLWPYPLTHPVTSTSLNHFNLGRWSSSGSDKGITHFFMATEIQSREWEKKNKRTIWAWVNSSARRLSCDTLHSWCICRLTLACISSEISTKLPGMPTHPDWPSLTASRPYLMPTGPFCCPASTAHCPSASPVANCLLWVPSSNSSLSRSLTHFRSRRRSRAQAFVLFRAKTDKGIVCLADHSHSVTRPLTSHLTNHISKTSKICEIILKTYGRTHKPRSFMDSFTWTRRYCLTYKDLHTSALCGHRMQSRRLTLRDGRLKQMMSKRKRERENESRNSSLSGRLDDIYIYIYI